MALAIASRQRSQPNKILSSSHRQTSILIQQSQWSTQKQKSFIETGSKRTSLNNFNKTNLNRGLSVNRSLDNLRQKLFSPQVHSKNSNVSYIFNEDPFDHQSRIRKCSASAKTYSIKFAKNLSECSYIGNLNKDSKSKYRKNSIEINKGLVEKEIRKESISHAKDKTNGCILEESSVKRNHQDSSSSLEEQTVSFSKPSTEHRINLNILLSQQPKDVVDLDLPGSDVENDPRDKEKKSDPEIVKKNIDGDKAKLLTQQAVTIKTTLSANISTATQRRAQFQASRTPAVTASQNGIQNNVANTPVSVGGSQTNLGGSPSLAVQRRPPLVRAMSAPVRSFDENSKGIFGANKRKSRRRKGLSREKVSDEKYSAKDILVESDSNGNKKFLSRTKSVAPDLITLVSLLSSEGSDSEKEDTNKNSNILEHSPLKRAPLLRKTGKSVSFQENFPPNFNLASKEYSQMLRRGSILPLAARLRSSRPPTAPPVSIFITEANKAVNTTSDENTKQKSSAVPAMNKISSPFKKGNKVDIEMIPDIEYPLYVRSLKEKECWKLYMKMTNKGISVSYETIARGMLTPTEFRQLQKQRDQEEEKQRLKEEEEAKEALESKKTPSAIERLSESLLKKK